MKERRTRQLAAVSEVVNAAHDHPTAEEVHRRVRRKLPRVSLGTVYRNLAEARGAATGPRRAAGGPRRALRRHDRRSTTTSCASAAAPSPICCASTAPRPRLPDLGRAGYVVRSHALTFYGVCPKCRESPEGRRSGACAALMCRLDTSWRRGAHTSAAATGRDFSSRTLLLGLVVLASCSDSSAPPKQTVVATPVDPATAGTIRVDVTLRGAVPPPKGVRYAHRATVCGARIRSRCMTTRCWSQDGHVANAVVWIKGGLEKWVFAPPSEPVVIDQKGCVYHPHVAAVMVGQPVEFVNSDPEAHNVHARPQVVSAFNFLMSRQGSKRTLTFDKAEVAVPVGCDIHPWMSAYVAVVANPYFAVTPANGVSDADQRAAGRVRGRCLAGEARDQGATGHARTTRLRERPVRVRRCELTPKKRDAPGGASPTLPAQALAACRTWKPAATNGSGP